jgi:hypothetical protein
LFTHLFRRQTRAQPLMIMAIRLAGLPRKNRDQSE